MNPRAGELSLYPIIPMLWWDIVCLKNFDCLSIMSARQSTMNAAAHAKLTFQIKILRANILMHPTTNQPTHPCICSEWHHACSMFCCWQWTFPLYRDVVIMEIARWNYDAHRWRMHLKGTMYCIRLNYDWGLAFSLFPKLRNAEQLSKSVKCKSSRYKVQYVVKLKMSKSLFVLYVELVRPGVKIMCCEIEFSYSVGNASMLLPTGK